MISSETVLLFERFPYGIPSLPGDGDKNDRVSPVTKHMEQNQNFPALLQKPWEQVLASTSANMGFTEEQHSYYTF